MKTRVLAIVSLGAAYWAFAGEFSATEAVAGVIAMAMAAGLIAAGRGVTVRRLAFRVPWLRLVLQTMQSISKDSFKVGLKLVTSLVRRRGSLNGSIQRQPFNIGNDSPHAAGRRAVVTLSISASPDRYVIDVNAEEGLFTHSLVGGATNADRDWPV